MQSFKRKKTQPRVSVNPTYQESEERFDGDDGDEHANEPSAREYISGANSEQNLNPQNPADTNPSDHLNAASHNDYLPDRSEQPSEPMEIKQNDSPVSLSIKNYNFPGE